jgi:CubicO group peptidase (beta-lactamase class C family)
MAERGPGPGRVTGSVSPGFEGIQERFESYLRRDPGYSAQLSVYHRGDAVVDLAGGPFLAADSLCGLFSASKGLAALAFATLIDDGSIDVARPVAYYWPEFALQGKAEIAIETLLSHGAGLLGVDGGFADDEVLESAKAAARIAQCRPSWKPGTAFGYHGLTIGIFMEELTRRVTATSLQAIYEERVRASRNIDAYLGLPSDQDPRFVPVRPLQPTPEQAAELERAGPGPDGLAAVAFNNVNNLVPLDQIFLSPNTREVRAAGVAALGAVGSARGVARAYAAALGHVGDPLVSRSTLELMRQQQSWGRDRVSNQLAAFGIVFALPHPGKEFASYQAFGHDGASGSLGFADPLYDLAFGYVPNPMQYPGGCDSRSIQLSLLARQAIS